MKAQARVEAERTYDGHLTVVFSRDDPGDMGEPREFSEDGTTYLVVPDPSLWGSAPLDEGVREVMKLMVESLQRGFNNREELKAAEAEQRRLQTQLALATERVELLRDRHQSDGILLREMWGFVKAELRSGDASVDAAS